MIKHILFTGIILLTLTGLACAGSYGQTVDWEMSGSGALQYPNEGWVKISSYDVETGVAQKGTYIASYTGGGTLYVHGHGRMYTTGDVVGHNNRVYGSTSGSYEPHGFSDTISYGGSFEGSCVGSTIYISQLSSVHNTEGSAMHSYISVYISPNPFDTYNITGNVGCLDNVSLYTYINGSYQYSTTNTSDYYLFEVVDEESYKLIFSNGHEYEFAVVGSDITYNYDACIKTTYDFKEFCGNLIPDSEGFYIEKIGNTVYAANNFYTSSGTLIISESPADNIYVSASPFFGQIGWFLDPIVNDTTYTLTNPQISWGLKVIVQNESDGSLIDDAMVKVDQDCYCTDGYSTRQKLTVNGMSQFGDMSLQDASLFVMKYGYKILDENTTEYSTFLSGRSNFSSKTWIVKLVPFWSENSSTFYEVTNKVDIHFRDVNGNRTSKILDTDSEVYLYYENNNTEEEAMTLKFQSSSTHTCFIDVQSWNIPYDEIGHKIIVNADFTPHDYSYRAVIYNSSIYGWNKTIPLTVRNATKEDEQHYENLTTNLWFLYANDGRVDYRDDMKIAIHAQSNNTTLMTIDVELWKDGVYIDCKNLTATDFSGANFPYYYVWNPTFDYVSGSNYSVRMYGFDRTILETDYVECITDDVTRKNKLTIIVKNQDDINLDNAFVYLEDYGSISTGTNHYASFEGLDNGYYRFKATKPDYVGTGWSDIIFSDSDETVTYTLTWSGSGEGGTMQQQKMKDADMSNIYLMLMAIVLIFVIFGGFKYAM